MKELNRNELLTVKGGVEIEGVDVGLFGSVDCNGYCYGQPENSGGDLAPGHKYVDELIH